MADNGRNGDCKNVETSSNRIDAFVGVPLVQSQQQNRRQQEYREESIRQVRSLSLSSTSNYNNVANNPYHRQMSDYQYRPQFLSTTNNCNNNIVRHPNYQQMLAMNYQYRPQLSYYVNYPVFQSHLRPLYVHRPQVDQPQTRSLHKKHDTDREDDDLKLVRYWDDLSTNNTNRGFEFTVMSYNILAQDLLEQHYYLYPNCKPTDLHWKTRWPNLYNEIAQFNPDVLCLQEVQETHLDAYFSQLKQLNYDWIYKRRTGIRIDGCAIFYKKDKFNLIDFLTVEFNQPKAPVLNRDNVAIIGKFTPKLLANCEFVIATTHLLYNPKRADVRLAQTQLLLTEIDRIAYKHTNNQHSYVPIIITGDLNSTPDSEVYRFLVNGSFNYGDLPKKTFTTFGRSSSSRNTKGLIPPTLRITDQCQHADLIAKRQVDGTLPRSEQDKLIELDHSERSLSNNDNRRRNNDDHHLFSSGTLSHKFRLKSVYNHENTSDPEGTTFQDRWVTVDYIFYSYVEEESTNLRLLSRYRLPTVSQLQNVNIPNRYLGSDHLSLLAKFKLIH